MRSSASAATLPQAIHSEAELDERLSRPSEALVASLGRGRGDLLVLGAGGKMGPTLARMARRAFDAAGRTGELIAVSRYTEAGARDRLEAHGVRTEAAALLNQDDLAGLPDAPDPVFMAGRKFGSSGAEHLTWTMNAYLPGLVAERYRGARTVVFSTGSVYPVTEPASGGATEETPVEPVGEYAQSCLGRERVLEYFSRRYRMPVAIIRLAYAVELRYGVLPDLATRVWSGAPIELSMGHTNLIWQGDACDMILRTLEHAGRPCPGAQPDGPGGAFHPVGWPSGSARCWVRSPGSKAPRPRRRWWSTPAAPWTCWARRRRRWPRWCAGLRPGRARAGGPSGSSRISRCGTDSSRPNGPRPDAARDAGERGRGAIGGDEQTSRVAIACRR